MNQRHYMYLAILIMAIAACLPAGPGFAQRPPRKNPCDPGLPVGLKDRLSYQLRGDRCEGRYAVSPRVRNLSGVLRVVSFVESVEEYDPTSEKELQVEWRVPQPKEVSLRAAGLQAELFYRMDVTIPPNKTYYRWPIEILQNLSISRNELGVLGWASYKFSDGIVRDIYLPLRISQNQPAKASPNYRVVIWPTQELSEVFISVAALDSKGAPKNFIVDGKALGYGYYPKERGVHIDIPKPENTGVYYLQIGASFGKGAVVNIEHLFYHAE